MEMLSQRQILLASKEELVNVVLKLQKENKCRRKENEELPEPLNRPAKGSHKGSKPSSTDNKSNSVPPSETESKKKGPLFDHTGTSRTKREADIVLVQKVKARSVCKTKIDSDSTTYGVHSIYELPTVRILMIDLGHPQPVSKVQVL